MKINKLQINAFGNIQDKEIELSNGINVVYGKNEAGKSTLLKFIVDILYGISKNKRGKEFSDYDRYKPWNTEEFSGKISYTLDNGNKYEVFRDFNKKNPLIYDAELNDISKQFTIDKTDGNQFFKEQTKIDEATFLSTLVSMQQEVKLEKQEQNVLVQKLANLAGTGNDNISYKKAIEKINKKQIEEIGTSRSQGRPINIIKEEKFKLQDEIGELEEFKDKQYEIEDIRDELNKTLQEEEKKLTIARQLKQIEEDERIEKQKIEINNNIIKTNNEKIENLRQEKIKKETELETITQENSNENYKGKRNYKLSIIATIVLAVVFAIISVIVGQALLFIPTGIFTILAIILLIISNKNKKVHNKEAKNKKDKEQKRQQEYQNQIDQIDTQINILLQNNNEQKEEIQRQQNRIKLEIENRKRAILTNSNLINSAFDGLNYELENLQNNINTIKLKIHELDLDKNNILPKLEKLAEMEEQLENINEKEQELLKKNEAIELAKEMLEIAYTKMKQNVTPKFTENLSKNIERISDGKYKKVSINDEEGIIVEKENGEYISSEKLSVGTIDQLYLSLRFGAIKELSKENMPIILDEAFAYYDEDRLENILKYLNQDFKENQIIIFTCTNRENQILKDLNINYKEINI